MRKITPILGVLTLLLGVSGHTESTVLIQSGASSSFERVAPNAATAPAGVGFWRCVSSGDIGDAACTDAQDADEEYGTTYDGLYICNDENVVPLTEEARIGFATPTANPVSTSNAQTIRIHFGKTNATCAENTAQADPTIDVYVYDGSTLQLIGNDLACDDVGTGTQDFEITWTYVGGSDGSEVYVELFDNGNGETGTSRRRCGVEAIDWYAETN